MELSFLTAISPVDGRYRGKVSELAKYFSEFALMKYRLIVETEYFIAFCEAGIKGVDDFDSGKFGILRAPQLPLQCP